MFMGVIRIAEGGYVPAGTCYSYSSDPVVQTIASGLSFNENLKRWARDLDDIIVGDVVRNSEGAILSAAVKWPDGVDGTYTADTLSLVFPGQVDAYHVTYGNPVTKTFTQPLMTRNVLGLVINLPEVEVS